MPVRRIGRTVVLVAEDEADLESAASVRETLEGLQPGQRVERRIPLAAGPGRRLAVAVRSDSPRGRSGGLSNVVILEIAPLLAAPARLSASVEPQGIRLDWDPVENASGYQVYRRNPAQSEFSLVGQAETAGFTDPAISWGVSYRYFVRPFVATSAGIAEGADSRIVEITPEDVFPPSAPSGLQAAVAENSVSLVWNLSPEADTAGYHVHRDGVRLTESPLVAPAFTDSDIQRGRRYSYEVSAVDQHGNESPRSAPIQVAIP